MSSWKAIKDQAEAAKSSCQSPSDIPSYFSKLLNQYPNDPMVYYIRGETYEIFGHTALACSDFEFAFSNFPETDWKKKAEAGMERVRSSESHS